MALRRVKVALRSIESELPAQTGGMQDVSADTVQPTSREELESLLKTVQWPVHKASLAPATHGLVIVRAQFGLAGRRMQPPTVSLNSKRMPRLTRLLFGYLRHVMPHAAASSATVAFHRHAKLHADTMNLGPSWATAMGAESGGDLWVCDGMGQDGLLLPTSHRFCEFNSQYGHKTLPFTGPRFYVSFYTHRTARRATRACRAKLERAGVPFPSVQELAAWKHQQDRLPSPQARLVAAKAAWDRHLRAHPDHFVSRKILKAGRASWVCRYCGRFGAAAAGRPKAFCDGTCRQAYWRKQAGSRALGAKKNKSW